MERSRKIEIAIIILSLIFLRCSLFVPRQAPSESATPPASRAASTEREPSVERTKPSGQPGLPTEPGTAKDGVSLSEYKSPGGSFSLKYPYLAIICIPKHWDELSYGLYCGNDFEEDKASISVAVGFRNIGRSVSDTDWTAALDNMQSRFGDHAVVEYVTTEKRHTEMRISDSTSNQISWLDVWEKENVVAWLGLYVSEFKAETDESYWQAMIRTFQWEPRAVVAEISRLAKANATSAPTAAPVSTLDSFTSMVNAWAACTNGCQTAYPGTDTIDLFLACWDVCDVTYPHDLPPPPPGTSTGGEGEPWVNCWAQLSQCNDGCRSKPVLDDADRIEQNACFSGCNAKKDACEASQ